MESLVPLTGTRWFNQGDSRSIYCSCIFQWLMRYYYLKMSIKSILIYLGEVGAEYPNISFFLAITLFCWLGNFIMTQYLMEKQIRHTNSKIVFLITFSCSLSLLSMYLFEILSFKIDRYYWTFSLIVLVSMCEVVIPICLIFRLPFAGYHFKCFSINVPIIGLIISSLYLFFFYELTLSMKQSFNLNEFRIKIFVEIAVSYGVYLMALMSAYGAIWCPYVYYNLINQKERHKIKLAKKKMQEQIHFIINQTKVHKYELLTIRRQIQIIKKEIQLNKNSNGSTLNKLVSFFTMSATQTRESKLKKIEEKEAEHQRELQTLRKVHEDCFIQYRDILEEERRHLVSQTLFGKMYNKMSFGLATYSVSRIVLTIINTIRGRQMSADPITRLANFLQQTLEIDLGPTFQELTQYVSFMLMGYIMITSVRSFSMNFKKFIDYILGRKRLNVLDTATQIYMFALIYGIYFLAAVVLQQSGLPRAYVTNFQIITGHIDLLKHFVMFDWLFMGMCFFSICLVFFTESQRGGKLNIIIRQRNIIDTSTKI